MTYPANPPSMSGHIWSVRCRDNCSQAASAIGAMIMFCLGGVLLLFSPLVLIFFAPAVLVVLPAAALAIGSGVGLRRSRPWSAIATQGFGGVAVAYYGPAVHDPFSTGLAVAGALLVVVMQVPACRFAAEMTSSPSELRKVRIGTAWAAGAMVLIATAAWIAMAAFPLAGTSRVVVPGVTLATTIAAIRLFVQLGRIVLSSHRATRLAID